MFAKVLLAGALALVLSGCMKPAGIPREATATTPTPWLIDNNIITRITCFGPGGGKVGTGIVIDSNRILTARHVVHNGLCTVDGIGVLSVTSHEGSDFADVTVNNRSAWSVRALVSCEGYREGEIYLASGYALGSIRPITQLVIASQSKDERNHTYLRGSFTPGMSGGPVFDLRGRLVGIVNAYTEKGITLAYSLALKDSSVCSQS